MLKEVAAKLANKEITKKRACEMLNMAYNTKRLDSMVAEFLQQQETTARLRAQKRKEAISKEDKRYAVEEYLAGESLEKISEALFRSTLIVKRILEEYNIPLRTTKEKYVWVESAADYQPGALVYSAKYMAPAKIICHFKDDVYRIWLYGNYDQYAYQPAYELADLTALQNDLKVDIKDIPSDFIRETLYNTMVRKNDKD